MMSTEQKIKSYVMEHCHKSLSEVTNQPLHRLLSLIEMKDMDKYKEFRTLLRKDGWII